MSSFATMYSFARKHGLRYFVTQEQADQLSYYFEPEQLSLNVIDRSLPQYYLSLLGLQISRLYWETPWERVDDVDNNFDYSRIDERELHRGRALNMGDYPNKVRDMLPYLADIRARLKPRARFRERAEDLLQAELMRRNMAGADITWVGVHNRRGDYKVTKEGNNAVVNDTLVAASSRSPVRPGSSGGGLLQARYEDLHPGLQPRHLRGGHGRHGVGGGESQDPRTAGLSCSEEADIDD